MSLPNPGMDFDPFDILPASQLDDLVENIEALATGTGLNDSAIVTAKIANGNVTFVKLAAGTLRLGLGTGSGATLTTSYVTHSSVTATSHGGVIELQWGCKLGNANSGADRSFDIQILCDGVTTGITPATLNFDSPFISGTTTALFYGFTHNQTAPSAASHTWELQFKASAGSAVTLSNNYLKVREIV